MSGIAGSYDLYMLIVNRHFSSSVLRVWLEGGVDLVLSACDYISYIVIFHLELNKPVYLQD